MWLNGAKKYFANMIIYTVDAFTSMPFKGNPAGVCIIDEFPDLKLMQNISLELSYANTAFVKPLGPNHFQIRWFTPLSEAPLCGHATLACMHILTERKLIDTQNIVTFESLSGTLTATVENKFYTLNFPSYATETVKVTNSLRQIVNYEPIYVGFSQNCYIMEFENSESLSNLEVNLEQLKKIPCRALIATSQGKEYDFHSRYFAPSVGINEDPVCASAHCRLIPFWAAKLNKQEMVSYQLSKRGGILKCKNLQNRVLISGEAVTVMVTQFLGQF